MFHFYIRVYTLIWAILDLNNRHVVVLGHIVFFHVNRDVPKDIIWRSYGFIAVVFLLTFAYI